VKKSSDANGASWGSSTTLVSDSNYGSHYLPILSQLANGAILGIFDDNFNGAIKSAVSTAWTTLTQIDTGRSGILQFGSAVSNSTYAVNFVYVYSDQTLRYRSYNGAWSNPYTIAPPYPQQNPSNSPTISLGNLNSLNLLFTSSNTQGQTIYYLQYSSRTGWGFLTTPLNVTSFNSPAYLSAAADSSNGLLISTWTEGTAAPYTIKFASLPVTQVWSPYSDPWDQEGIIPYGEYYNNFQEYVSPFNGLLTITQTDFSLPGRGFKETGPLSFTRVFRMPDGLPYSYENYPYANFGVGWSLDWPWMGTNNLHLAGGQGYRINLDGLEPGSKIENHQGEQFVLSYNTDGTYSVVDKSGTVYVFNSNKQLTYILDPTQKNQITFNWNPWLGSITDTLGRSIAFTYDSNTGRVTTVSAAGRVWTYGYNTNGNLVSVTDPVGRVTRYEYSTPYGNSYLSKITYPTGGYTTYTYSATSGTDNPRVRVNQQTVFSGGATVRQETFSYTPSLPNYQTSSLITFSDGSSVQGYLNYVFTLNNVTITTENSQAQPIRKAIKQFNSYGQVIQETVSPSGSGTSYTNYFGFDKWANIVYRRLAVTSNTYRETFYSFSNTTTQDNFVNYAGTNMTNNFLSAGCPVRPNPFTPNIINATIHDRILGQVEFPNGIGGGNPSYPCEAYFSHYDSQGNLLQQKQLLGTGTWLTTTYTYDAYGNMLTLQDAKGNQFTYQYSSTYQSAYLTQMSTTVSGLSYSTSYAYNFATGDQVSVTSASGNVTSYGYDSIDRLTSITYPSIGGVRAMRSTVYDDVNLIVTAYDENNNYAKSYYDSLARLTLIQTFAGGAVYSTASSSYFWNDKLKAYTDQTGNVTSYTYDFVGRMLTLNHPDGTYKQWTYNDAATPIQVTAIDERGHSTDYYYDWQNRLVTVTEHATGQRWNTAYSYDTVGNLVQVTDAKSQITSYGYDNLNRVIQTTFPDTTFETRTYDSVGNLVSRVTQNNAIIQYGYDEINRLTKITYPDSSTVTYTYDKDSNRLGMTDSTSTTTYTYDARNRLLSETRTISGQSYPLSYQYDQASNLIQLTYPDGTRLSYTYDALNRISTVGSLATLTYRKNNEIATISFGNGVQTAYSYDKLGRATRIRTWNRTMTLLDLNYAYDANGNPTSVNSGQETYGYDDLNRLTSASGPFGTLSYSYDQVGNRLSAVVNGITTNYAYGSYNKLLSASGTSYSYDNNGNTISKTSGSNAWSYTYDYENRLRQAKLSGQLVLQALYDGDGRRIETIAGDTTIYHYLGASWDPAYLKDLTTGTATDIVFAGRLRIGRIQGGVNYYYHLDRLGSVRLVTQNANVQSFSAKYLPYGATYATSGSESFQFTGKQLDVSSGLSYFGYRYYDSQMGRFATQDLASERLVAPQTLNRYSYALNSPLAKRDSDGRQEVDPDAVLRALSGLFDILEGLGPEGELAVVIVGAVVVGSVAAYNYLESQALAPGGTKYPPRLPSPPEVTPPLSSEDQRLLESAAMAYMERLRVQRLEVVHLAKETLDAIEKMLEAKMKNFGFESPPEKVPGGWI
jgi:RHS repeat-associated protein